MLKPGLRDPAGLARPLAWRSFFVLEDFWVCLINSALSLSCVRRLQLTHLRNFQCHCQEQMNFLNMVSNIFSANFTPQLKVRAYTIQLPDLAFTARVATNMDMVTNSSETSFCHNVRSRIYRSLFTAPCLFRSALLFALFPRF